MKEKKNTSPSFAPNLRVYLRNDSVHSHCFDRSVKITYPRQRVWNDISSRRQSGSPCCVHAKRQTDRSRPSGSRETRWMTGLRAEGKVLTASTESRGLKYTSITNFLPFLPSSAWEQRNKRDPRQDASPASSILQCSDKTANKKESSNTAHPSFVLKMGCPQFRKGERREKKKGWVKVASHLPLCEGTSSKLLGVRMVRPETISGRDCTVTECSLRKKLTIPVRGGKRRTLQSGNTGWYMERKTEWPGSYTADI